MQGVALVGQVVLDRWVGALDVSVLLGGLSHACKNTVNDGLKSVWGGDPFPQDLVCIVQGANGSTGDRLPGP